jgi:hypothetical protein
LKERTERGKVNEDRFDEHESYLFLTWRKRDSTGLDVLAQVPDFRTRSGFGYQQGTEADLYL